MGYCSRTKVKIPLILRRFYVTWALFLKNAVTLVQAIAIFLSGSFAVHFGDHLRYCTVVL